jgi:hypothetical protein
VAREGYDIRRAGTILVAACLLAISGSAALARASAPDPGPWVGLDSGRVGGYEWSVKVRRPGGPAGAGPLGARRPCLLVGATWPVGRLSYGRIKARQCAGADGHLAASEPPLIAAGAQPSEGSTARMTAVGMVVAPSARRIQVTYSNGRRSTIHLHLLGPAKARQARLGPLRFAAFVVRGAWCVERVLTQDAAGQALWDSGTDAYPCPSE